MGFDLDLVDGNEGTEDETKVCNHIEDAEVHHAWVIFDHVKEGVQADVVKQDH